METSMISNMFFLYVKNNTKSAFFNVIICSDRKDRIFWENKVCSRRLQVIRSVVGDYRL